MESMVQASMEVKEYCKVCGASSFETALEKDQIKFLRCTECGFVFAPGIYRKTIHYVMYKDSTVYMKMIEGNDDFKLYRHMERVGMIRRFVPSGKLLDVGSGWGHFMKAAEKYFDVFGYEISKFPLLYSRKHLNLKVDKIDLSDPYTTTTGKVPYDVVTAWDVIEHIDNWNTMIRNINRILKIGGYFVFQVPAFDSILARLLKTKWHAIGRDNDGNCQHINFFTRKTIRQVMKMHGFDVVKIKSGIELKHWFMYAFFKKKAKHSERQDHFNNFTKKPKWKLKMILFIHDVLYKVLQFLKIGDEMIVIAKKKS